MSAVTLEHVTKRFGHVVALDDVSLQIESGEMIALLGPSGCGKTTLLRSVAGLERPTSGRIHIAGTDVTDSPTRERPIGMVFQSYALFPNMTVRENIAFPLTVRHRPSAEIASRVDELLDIVRLGPQADRYPNQISGGQAQRCALGRALAPAPDVLLLDEPLSALDALVRTRLRDEIRRIQQRVKTTAIYVTHDQSEAMAIADRVAVMNRGVVEQIAAPAHLYEEPATHFSATFVGSRNALELPVRDGRIGLGEAFSLPAPPGVSDRAVAFFRPEDVTVAPSGEHGQPATIELKIFQGSSTRVYLVTEVEGQQARLYADLPSRQAARVEQGSPVAIRIDPTHVRAFAVGD
ncbi:MAG TPA: ABC transporter ATP-binding protein [Candidatus Dormibacteraeota bacterium]|nr:ABC transporter ATP-binding protein [Candidatus Dormibacteraeota bacterium]